MTESSFRSKYAGMPGSLVAIRVDYARRGVAFDSLPTDSKVVKTKREVKRWKMGHRLGDPPEWNGSAQPDNFIGGAPQRPLLHQLCEYQAVSLNYNYRASTLPDVNIKTRFVPKASKLQVDRSMFMSANEKKMLTEVNQGTRTSLSRTEISNHSLPGVEREASWNISTELDHDRTNIYRCREYDSFIEVNKTKSILDHSRYVSPPKRFDMSVKLQREAKLNQREASLGTESRGASQSAPAPPGPYDHLKVYKMSNINEWWDENFDVKMLETASAVLGRPIVATAQRVPAPPTGENRPTNSVTADP